MKSRSYKRILRLDQQKLVGIFVIVLFAVFAWKQPAFSSVYSIQNILSYAGMYGIGLVGDDVDHSDGRYGPVGRLQHGIGGRCGRRIARKGHRRCQPRQPSGTACDRRGAVRIYLRGTGKWRMHHQTDASPHLW